MPLKVAPVLGKTRAAKKGITVDGCPFQCSRRTIEAAGFKITKTIVLVKDIGMKKKALHLDIGKGLGVEKYISQEEVKKAKELVVKAIFTRISISEEWVIMKTKLSRRQIVPFLLFTFFVMLVSIPVAALAQPSGEVYIYSFPESPSSEILLRYFNNKSGWKVIDYDLNNSTYSYEFTKIVYTLATEGVEVVPPGICISCELAHGRTWEQIYLSYCSPLIGFFRNGRLTAITIAITDYNVLDQALMVDDKDCVKVFTFPYRTFNLTGEDIRIRLEGNFFLGQEELDDTDFLRLLPLIITAAAVDTINPCEFSVLIVFLSLVVFRTGRKAVLKAGIAFSIAIFIIYYLMGFGLLQLITYAQEARLLIVILGVSVGLYIGLRDTIGSFLNKKFKRVPEFFSKRLSAYLRRVSENPMMAFAIGVVASAFLLPCTSGPYLIALSLIANLETLLEGLFLLTVYNSIIMIPFLAITLGIYMLKLKTGELKRWSSQKQRWLNLVAGLLMIFLSLYLLFTIIL